MKTMTPPILIPPASDISTIADLDLDELAELRPRKGITAAAIAYAVFLQTDFSEEYGMCITGHDLVQEISRRQRLMDDPQIHPSAKPGTVEPTQVLAALELKQERQWTRKAEENEKAARQLAATLTADRQDAAANVEQLEAHLAAAKDKLSKLNRSQVFYDTTGHGIDSYGIRRRPEDGYLDPGLEIILDVTPAA